MMEEKREKQILLTSFISGLLFAIFEFIFAIYSRSHSSLTDAVYDASELVFIALLIFLTPLFHKPVSEKHPYGYFQVESIFIIIKSVMMLSVTIGVGADVLKSIISGGNSVNNTQVALFQLFLGLLSVMIYIIMKKMSTNLSSPTIQTELVGWKLDILYSLGMSSAFFIAVYLNNTALSFLSPYFDQIVAIIVMVFMLPESIKILWDSVKELFLFSPDDDVVDEIKKIAAPILDEYNFTPVFYDITKTGRHIWVAIYFKVKDDSILVDDLSNATQKVNSIALNIYQECTCELILVP